MKVKELIEQLSKFDPEIEVIVSYDDPGADEPTLLKIFPLDSDSLWKGNEYFKRDILVLDTDYDDTEY